MKVNREQPAPATSIANKSNGIDLRSRIASPRGLQGLAELSLAARAIHYLPLELPARGIDIVPARTAHRRNHAGFVQQFLECPDRGFVWSLEASAGERIERNQVDLGGVLH